MLTRIGSVKILNILDAIYKPDVFVINIKKCSIGAWRFGTYLNY